MNGSQVIKVVYVTSSAYSGSTLLAILMATHPAFASNGEVVHSVRNPNTYPCSCGELIIRCPFWCALQERMKKVGLDFDPANSSLASFHQQKNRYLRKLETGSLRSNMLERIRHWVLMHYSPYSSWRSTTLKYNIEMFRAILEITGRELIVDASKDPLRMFHLSQCSEIELYVIHLIRDGRGQINSAKKNDGTPIWYNTYRWLAVNYDIKRIVNLVHPKAYFRIRYEDLCRNPKYILGRIAELCGVAHDGYSLDSNACEFHVIGNRMRKEKGLQIRLDEKWRKELSHKEIKLFELLAGHWNRRHGYS